MTEEEREKAKKHFNHGLYKGIDFCVGLFSGHLPFDEDDIYRVKLVKALIEEYKERERQAESDNV